MKEAAKASGGDVTLRKFLDFVAEADRNTRKGISIIAVSMQELHSALDMGSTRADLAQRLDDKARSLKARLFNLNDRMFFLVPPQHEWDFMQAVYDVRMLVLKTAGRAASEVGVDPSDFTRVLTSRADGDQIRRLAESAVYGSEDLNGPVGAPGPLTQDHIEGIEKRARRVGNVAFAREFGRMQAMVRMRPGEAPTARGREIFISMATLRKQLLPGVDIMSNRNLFQELTMRLDRITLRSLGESRLVQGRVSVNMNVTNLLTEEFERIAQRLYERDNSELWVELDVADILANLKAYRQAQAIFRRFNVFPMADSVAPELVSAVQEANLGLHGYKFVFPENDPSMDRLADAIDKIRGTDVPVILTRVEHDAAIQAGQSLGIQHFQGFYIDELLNGDEVRPLQ